MKPQISSNWGWNTGNGWYLEGAFGTKELFGNLGVNPFNYDDKIIAFVTPL